jgi:hypothetical protein
MRLMTTWRAAALTGALLLGACSKEPAPAQAPAPKPTPAAKEPAADSEPAAEPEAEAEAQAPEAAAQPTPEPVAPPTGEPPQFKVGMKRDEVMRLFSGCAERKLFIPPGPGALYVEIYQAREDEACIKWLGDRHFLIRGDALHSISPGRMPEPKYVPPPEGV